MSQVYNLEPPTQGKVRWPGRHRAALPPVAAACSHKKRTEPHQLLQVVLRTTLGDLDIELWPKEAPKAVRNFVQLCMEGYYDGTIFHRMIKDFMAQGECFVADNLAQAVQPRVKQSSRRAGGACGRVRQQRPAPKCKAAPRLSCTLGRSSGC